MKKFIKTLIASAIILVASMNSANAMTNGDDNKPQNNVNIKEESAIEALKKIINRVNQPPKKTSLSQNVGKFFDITFDITKNFFDTTKEIIDTGCHLQ